MNRITEIHIPYSRPRLGPEEEAAVIDVLRSGWLTTGSRALAFEQEFARITEKRYALAVNSATAGMHLALEAIGISEGDYVAVSPYTFTASCEVMRYLGAHPWFVDIGQDSIHMDPILLARDLERSARGEIPPIKAIMPVHIGGIGIACKEIYALARRWSLPVIEDAAHAFPARSPHYGVDESDQSVPVWLGTGGTIGVYSFYANKTITTGEGGMIVCDDEALVSRMRTMRLHGIDREVWNRYTGKTQQWRYDVIAPGYKYNLPDTAAAIGLVQLAKADAFMFERKRIAQAYTRAFSGHRAFVLPPLHPEHRDTGNSHPPQSETEHSWHLYTLRIRPEATGIGRDTFIERLSEAGVGTSVHFIPLNHMTYYRETYGIGPDDFPRATKAFETCISLPIYPGLTDSEREIVIEEVLKIADTP